MGGPFRDSPGGLVIIQAESREKAEAIGAADPGVTSGVLEFSVLEWRPIDWAHFASDGVEFAETNASVKFDPSHTNRVKNAS
jgi:hypothetical protein